MTTEFKLGKLPARPGAVKLSLLSYIDKAVVFPTVPSKIGRTNLLPKDLGVLGNAQFGDCVWAGAAHESMLWNLEQGRTVQYTDQTVLSDYSAVTGFNPSDPNTDQGTDMQVAASYRRKTGILAADGTRHKIDAYLALTPGDVNELRMAIYLFGAVGIGVNFPGFWMDQFNAGKEWTYRKGAAFEGGHYIPGMASASPKGALTIATWGKLQKMSASAYAHYSDEAIAYVSLERLNASGKSLDGFDVAQLRTDLQSITAVV